ncbi:MAG TPA: FprA family A-type flavoprotein [Candidatus Coprenecus stercoripullorum]|nr:FprA family A-type flavoprotein [Candidatus Coprenecus stercoripullorum]
MIRISNKVFYLGTNDRKKFLFENNWPLPNGVAYNSYIIADEHTALIDTLEYGSNPDYLSDIDACLGGRPLEYLIVNHMEPDHSSMIGEVLRRYPQVRIVANSKTFKILESYYPVPSENILQVGDGSRLELGHHSLLFVLTPWVHWPETMMTYDTADRILFSCDAFGSFGTLDGGVFDDEVNFSFYEDEMRRYYSNIVGKWSGMVRKAFKKLEGVPVDIICPSHGIIWRTDPGKVLSLYDKWSRYESEKGVVIAFASMYGNTEKFADSIARALAVRGIKDIRVHDASRTHASFILSDIWKYKGLILGSCAYNTGMHPMMQLLVHEISVSAPSGKVLGIFGGSSWNASGSKALMEFAAGAGMPVVGNAPIEFLGRPYPEDIGKIEAFADKFAEELGK